MKNKFDSRMNNSFLLKFSLIVRLKMNKDLILQILTKAHYLIPRKTYLRIYPYINPVKTTFDNLEMIAIELHEDIVLTDTIQLLLTDINDSLTKEEQIEKEDIKEIMDSLDSLDSLDLPPETPTGTLKSQNATK